MLIPRVMLLTFFTNVLAILSLASAFSQQAASIRHTASRVPFTHVRSLSSPLWSLKSGTDDSPSLSVSLKEELLGLIPERPFGAPATNLTTTATIIQHIEETVAALEPLSPFPTLTNSTAALESLGGDWQLLYSDASEITRITKLPLGFRLGPVFQPINVEKKLFENQALIKHRFFLVSGHTRVMANFWLAPIGETNRAGIVNLGARANVKFQRVIFSLRRFLIFPTWGKIRKTAIPNGPSEQKGIIPSIDITYLDDDLRISRGGDGSLFILVRADGKDGRKKPMPMLECDASDFVVPDSAPTYDASVDILPSGSPEDIKK
eukprot:CAMPEP_0198295984 /NCGR_PEP_ID=MMETSP1449-20131203/30367_1 /TAXON_ID=420275 /ORGANISM="Attheya septentrionalis, Strain CCMP2084" /LENGTH=320 /DNA_ID=CAMNT_0043996439 /DNA_START=106 /DNA_END=1068 /DNA_ORIENTATION=+